MTYYCYMLYSDVSNKTYIGITNNLDRRLKQHNGYLRGGAKSTRHISDWKYKMLILFHDYKLATSFEYYAKHKQNSNGKWIKTTGLKERLERINYILSLAKFTLAKKIEI